MLSFEDAKEIRRLYDDEGLSMRVIAARFGLRNPSSIREVLDNRRLADPLYVPTTPQERRQRRRLPEAIEINGEALTASEWASHPSCQVRANTILKRYREGVRGPDLLKKFSEAGRPRNGG